MKNCPNSVFSKYLTCFKAFASYLHRGMPHEVVEFLSNPDMYELNRKTHVLETIESNEDHEEDHNINDNTDPDYVVEPPSFHSHFKLKFNLFQYSISMMT